MVANSQSDSVILARTAINGMTSSSLNMNGDDALALFHGVDTLDIFGEIGIDPGAFWGTTPNRTQNNTLLRKTNITMGDTTNPISFLRSSVVRQ